MFTATQAGALSAAATFGGVGVPGITDDVDVAGFALTQGTSTGLGSLIDSEGGGSLTLDTGGTFTCPSVIDVPIIIPSGVTATLDFGDPAEDGGCQYSGSSSNNAIECQVGGTVTDVVGDLENSGADFGVGNDGTLTDFSGTLTNSGAGHGLANGATVTDFSGTLTNSGAGYGFYNGGTVDDVSGTITGSAGTPWSGPGPTALTGSITKAIPDLSAANILAGKTILGVSGVGGGRIIGG